MSKRRGFTRRQLLKYTAAGSAAGIAAKALGQAVCADTTPEPARARVGPVDVDFRHTGTT